ncbi:hypothetical protein CYY_003075 [Polysphondylium violaceum]|uniref:Polyketide synthase n=1 Tax=Polysphondylium violaceum TaxID=133409 RepID=A0A8J4PZ09_9MYCE|nr:hypothetical protein CYY_003075 [Polysphondylium violaceum]
MNNYNRVAVVGLGLRLPKSKCGNDLWFNLMNKFDGVVEIPKDRFSENFYNLGYFESNKAGLLETDEILSFDPLMFGIKPSDVDVLDPQQRMLLKVTYEALEDAHIKPSDVRGTNTSVFVGCYSLDFKHQLNNLEKPYFTQDTSLYSIANHVSHTFDFRGASMTVDTACSSSINAFIMGCKSIECGQSDLSIVGGVGLIFNSDLFSLLTNMKGLSPDGKSKSFDASANGFGRAEGCCMLVLKNLDKAIQDNDVIYGVVDGASSNSDGNFEKENINSPSSMAQAENLRLSLAQKNLNPSDIYYFECHGTGTIVGDKNETIALSMVFKDNHSNENPLYIGSIKSNIGHTEATSGACGIAKVCLMLKHRMLVPNIHFNTPNPNIDFKNWNLKVVTECIPFPNDRKVKIGINSFGITGSNGCVILSEFKNEKEIRPMEISCKNRNLLIPLSANSKHSLNKYQATIMHNHFINSINTSIGFNDFAKYLILSKSIQYSQRLVINSHDGWNSFSESSIFSNDKEMISNMFSLGNNTNPIVVFVYCGQGPQWNGMGSNLYENEPVFRETLDKFDNELSKHFGYSILQKLREATDQDSIHDPLLAQPSMFLLQCGLTELYKQWNVQPSIVTGHSFGEITALYYSGLISMEDSCKIVYERARLQHKTVGSGRMLAISLSLKDFNSKFPHHEIEIACFNSKNSIVISGDEFKLDEVHQQLQKEKIFSAFLGTKSSFHSSSQEIIKKELFDSVSNDLFKTRDSNAIMFSTTTSNQMNQFSTQLLFDNIRNPVLFEQTLNNINDYLEENNNGKSTIFVEISPFPTLSRYIKDQNNNALMINPLNRKRKESEQNLFKESLSQIYINGYNIDFTCQFDLDDLKDKSYKHLCSHRLPFYQWDEQTYLLESQVMKKLRLSGPPATILGNEALENQSSSNTKAFKTIINTDREPFAFLKGHIVGTKNYFPGCGYVDNLLQIYPFDNLVIQRLDFKFPFILKGGVDHELLTILTKISNTEYKVDFQFYENDQWTNSATGKILISPTTPPKSQYKIDFPEIRSRCNLSTISKDDLYKVINSVADISYHGSFQRVEETYFGIDCSLSKISMKPRVSKNCDNKYLFNPAILDSCLHGTFPLLRGPLKIIFERISNMKLFTENIKSINIQDLDYIYAFADNITIGKADNRCSFSLKVMLQDGTMLFEIKHVVCLSLLPMKSDTIKHPGDDLYSIFWQPKESILSIDKWIHENITILKNLPDQLSTNLYIQQYCTLILYYQISNKQTIFTKSLISTTPIEELQRMFGTSKYSQLFQLVFKVLKENQEFMISEVNLMEEKQILLEQKLLEFQLSKENFDLLKSSTKIISSLLFPNQDNIGQEALESLLNNDINGFIYGHKYLFDIMQMVKNVVNRSIQQNITQRAVVRILEIGSGKGELTTFILESLYKLLENQDSKIQIEFTFSDINPSFISSSKSKFSQYSDKISIVFTTIDIDKDFLEKQKLKGSYYDMILASNVLHLSSQVSFSISEIQKVLSHGGHLLFIEPTKNVTLYDFVFGAFNQWTVYKDTDIRGDHCCMTPDQWSLVLKENGFINICSSPSDQNHLNFIVYAQKPCLNSINLTMKRKDQDEPNVVIFSKDRKLKYEKIMIEKLQGYYKNCILVQNFDEMVELVQKLGHSDLIFNLSTISNLQKDNFKEYTMEYIKINQELLKLNQKCKHISIGLNSTKECSFYLNSSIVGAFRYFTRYNDCIFLDFDENTLENQSLDLNNLIEKLIDTKLNYHNEYSIRNGVAYIELIGRQDLQHLKHSPFEQTNFYSHFNSKLKLKLSNKPQNLAPNQVEIQVKSSGISYRDSLIYKGLETKNFNLFNEQVQNIGFGVETSGIVTAIGDKVTKFKTGDRVCGALTGHCFGSHQIVNQDDICQLPASLSFTDGASIPIAYLSAYRSIIKLGNLFDREEIESSPKSILIHSATSSIALACLNILKWRMNQTGIKIFVFVTVGSQDKENFLTKHYGSMIAGAFSSKNLDFVDQVKAKLLELGSEKDGVDVLINTFSIDSRVHANFSTLAQDGKLIDLSNSHLYNNTLLDFASFKLNIGYQTSEISLYPPSFKRIALNEILLAISNKDLDLLPIHIYPIDQLKEAIEIIGEESKPIGKLVVDYNKDITSPLVLKPNQNKVLKENYKIEGDIKCVLITGQQGVALEILRWLLENSKTITNVIILTQSSMKWDIKRTINKFKKTINFHFKSVNVGNQIELESTIKKIYEENPNIPLVDSIFHLAYTHTETEPLEITDQEMSLVHDSKSLAAVYLHEISLLLKWNIRNFFVSSSIVVLSPTFNQCAYTCANMVLLSFAKYRRSLGLKCTCLSFGSLEGAGFVSRKKAVESVLTNLGVCPTPITKVLATIDLNIHNSMDDVLIGKFNMESMKKSLERFPHFDYYLNCFDASNLNNDKTDDSGLSVKDKVIATISDFLSISSSKLNISSMKLKDYGVDSLFMVQLKNWVDKEFKPNIFSISQLQGSSIDTIIQTIEKAMDVSTVDRKDVEGKEKVSKLLDLYIESHSNAFWEKESLLDREISGKNKNLEMNNGQILLTGATGFLGSHILIDLLQNNKCKRIFCLVRANSKEEAMSRIYKTLVKYNLHLSPLDENRIIPIVSDLSKPLLGLSIQEFSKLSTSIDLIIHSAANVRFNVWYSQTNDTQILKEILKLVNSNRDQQIRFLHVSSISIHYALNEGVNVNEIPKLEANNNRIGYSQTKVIQENILSQAFNRNIPITIVRPPFIFSPTTPNPNDAIQLLFLASMRLKICPSFKETQIINSVSVSKISLSISNIAFDDKYWSKNDEIPIFNLYSKPISLKGIFESISKQKSWPILELDEWKKRVTQSNSTECLRLVPILSLFSPDSFQTTIVGNNQDGINENSFITEKDVLQFIESNDK